MSLHYKVVTKKPGGLTGEHGIRYYPMLTDRQTIHLRELCEIIGEANTFHSGTVFGVMETFLRFIPTLLMDGHNIHLGEFGTFSLSIRAVGQDSPDKVSSRDIKEVRMNFRPGPVIKHQLTGKIDYKKVK